MHIWKFAATSDIETPFVDDAYMWGPNCTVVNYLRRVTLPKYTICNYVDNTTFHELRLTRKNLMGTCRVARLVALETWKWKLNNLRRWTTVPGFFMLRRFMKLNNGVVVKTVGVIDDLIE